MSTFIINRLVELCGLVLLSALSGDKRKESNCVCEVKVQCPECECLSATLWVLVGACLGASIVLSWFVGTACWRRGRAPSVVLRERATESTPENIERTEIGELAKQQVLAVRRRR
eukprot:1119606-Amphidinium_carterae.1